MQNKNIGVGIKQIGPLFDDESEADQRFVKNATQSRFLDLLQIFDLLLRLKNEPIWMIPTPIFLFASSFSYHKIV
jgi:hypothetical protein